MPPRSVSPRAGRPLARLCAADGCFRDLDGLGKRRHAQFCSTRCGQRHRWRKGRTPPEPALSPYWREYLRRFDRALRERTPDAWAAAHELAPVPASQPHYYQGDFARLLRTLERD